MSLWFIKLYITSREFREKHPVSKTNLYSDDVVGGVCNFLGWTSVKALSYSSALFRKQREIHPRGVRVGWPKRCEEKRSPPNAQSGSSFICFFLLPLSLLYVNWASQEAIYLRFSLQSLDLPLFYFHGLFPSLSFSHHHFGLLFPILSKSPSSGYGRPNSLEIWVLRSLQLFPAELGWQGALGLPLLLVSSLRVLIAVST